MKKYYVILAAVAAFFTTSCTKETAVDTVAPAGMKEVTLTANTEVTKTSYDASGKFSWTKGDQISVWCSDEQFHTFTATESGASVVFSAMLPENVSLGWYAFFPADDNHADCKFNIPSYKDLSATNSADIPMVGEQDPDGAYLFKHCVGAAKITVTNVPDFCETVEISVATLKLKVSGLFSIYHDSTDPTVWTWSAAYGGSFATPAGPDSELVYARRVKVVNGTATIYLPYEWASQDGLRHDSTVDVKGFDSSNKEYSLLKGKVLGALGDFTRANVLQVKPLQLPAYVPPVDWSKVDWTSDAVATPTMVASLSEASVLADDNYIYVKMVAPSDLEWNKLYCYFGKGFSTEKKDGNAELGWGWATYVDDAYNVEGAYAEGALNVPGAETKVVTNGQNVEHYLAFPRNADDIFSAAGKVYVAFHLYNDGTWVGSFPKTWEYAVYALEVTLP